jgi:hypothetical protein
MQMTFSEEEELRIWYHFLSLGRFDMQNKLNYLEEFLRMQILTNRAQQMRDGDGYQARRRRVVLNFLKYRCIKDTRSDFFRKRETILYPLLISILVEALMMSLIHSGKGPNASSTFVKNSGRQHFLHQSNRLSDIVQPQSISFTSDTGP